MAIVLIGVPTYKGIMHAKAMFPIIRCSRNHKFDVGTVDSSATCVTFNRLWINALELYEAGKITHFLMYHSDIVAEEYFLDKMIDIMERTKADVLSAIVPIKDQQGMTSTAMDEPVGDVDPYWRVRRLTMKEVHHMEPTFTDPKLLLNTGLMLVDMSKAWTKDAYFTFEDKIIWHHGRRVAVCMPEDWGFSRMAKKLGATLWATREVPILHYGETSYPNQIPWGQVEKDVLPTWSPEASKAAEIASKVQGYMSWEELAWLADNAKNGNVIEVGSWLGRSTKAMAQTAKRILAVDHWKGSNNDATEEQAKGIDPYAEFNHNLSIEINQQKVVPMVMDHADVGKLEKRNADLVFIDGDHSYEAVVRDIKSCLPLVNDGGILAGHDYSEAHPGVIKAVKEFFGKNFKVAPDTSIWYTVPGPSGDC